MNRLRVLYAGNRVGYGEIAAAFTRRQTPLLLKKARSSEELLSRLSRDPDFDAILIERELPTLGALHAVERVVASGYPAPLLVLSDRGDQQIADAVVKAGAVDFVVRRPGYADAMPRILREAIDTFRLRERAEQAVRRQTELDALLSLQRRLCSGADRWESYELLAEALGAARAFNRLVVWEAEPDGFARARFLSGDALGLADGERRPLMGTLAGQALAERRAVAASVGPENLLPRGMVSAAAAPFFVDGEPSGAVEIASAGVAYDEAALRFLSAVSEQFSASLSLAARKQGEEEHQRQRARLEAVRQMGLTVSHELNQPLTIILGYLELLRSPDLDPELVANYRERVDEAGKDLAQRLHRIASVSGEAIKTFGDGMTVIDLDPGADSGSGAPRRVSEV
jgi:CheY-like chemotaxis protein